jgi:hypothetical protein
VSLSSVPKQAGECVKKTVTPGVEVQKSLYKQKNVIGVVAWMDQGRRGGCLGKK